MPLPRDFLETPEGLMFAVVEAGLEAGRALCFLRYRRESGGWRKLGTEAANRLLAEAYPHYHYYSPQRDAHLHGVELARVAVHHRPRQRLAELLAGAARDPIVARLQRLLARLADAGVDLTALGVTGSLLIGAQRDDSDFDLTVYGRTAFFRVREAVGALLAAGELQALSDALWQDSYQRRGCELDFAEYLRHERRKCNKAAFEGTKFDITLTVEDAPPARRYRKLGAASITARVTDASRAFDHPASYALDHGEIGEVVSFTQTYAGQALAGETVVVAGQLERADDGRTRIVVGSSREAPGEFIRVLP